MIKESRLNNMNNSFRENLSNVKSGLRYCLVNYILVPSKVSIYSRNGWYSDYNDFSVVVYAFWNISNDYKQIFREFCK